MRTAGLLLVLGSMAFMAACGGGGASSTVTSVTVSCDPTSVFSGQNSQCSATVMGTGNFSSSVTWTAAAGSITTTGLFTAPSVVASTPVGISATSTETPTVSGSTTITVNPGQVNNVTPTTTSPPQGTVGLVNEGFVTVTVCVPNTSTCQTIDHVLVDTGSIGLRLLATPAGPVTIPLPQELDSTGNTLGECQQFLDGFVWGTVNLATLTVAGETAPAFPVQLIVPSSSSPAVPSSCSSQSMGPNEGDSVQDLGANGILGVGFFLQDCGLACAQGAPDVYYDCPPSGCTPIPLRTQLQVVNPISLFGADGNGVLIQMQSVPDGGQPTATGSLIFGIGTQSNNGLGSATVYTVPGQTSMSAGQITTTYNGTAYPNSFIDSGSNGLFFLNSSLTGMPMCSGQNNSWYCPNSTTSFTASNNGLNNANNPVAVTFSIENADSLFSNNGGNDTAFSTLGGPSGGTSPNFDWGMPFFYGRNVFVAIDGLSTPAGPGPYVAY